MTQPHAHPSTTTADAAICGALGRSGAPCKRPTGWGTDSSFGRCKNHTGSTPTGRVAAAKAEAVATAAMLLGGAPNMAPHDALLLCVRSAAGEWFHWEAQTYIRE